MFFLINKLNPRCFVKTVGYGKLSFRIVECSSGTYGINCRETCSTNCNTPQSCNRTTGECIGGCQPGWKGLHCDQSMVNMVA